MASARNNRIQERRTALREQQKREREAADAAFKALDSEYEAQLAAAAAVAAVVELSGKERAGALLGLEPRDVNAYVKLLEDLATGGSVEGQGAGDGAEESLGSGEPDALAGVQAAAIPAQSEAAAAAASAS